MKVVKATVSPEDYDTVHYHWDREGYLDGEQIRIEFHCGDKAPVIMEMS